MGESPHVVVVATWLPVTAKLEVWHNHSAIDEDDYDDGVDDDDDDEDDDDDNDEYDDNDDDNDADDYADDDNDYDDDQDNDDDDDDVHYHNFQVLPIFRSGMFNKEYIMMMSVMGPGM